MPGFSRRCPIHLTLDRLGRHNPGSGVDDPPRGDPPAPTHGEYGQYPRGAAGGGLGFLIKSEHFDLIRNAGFSAVRIPIRWSAHAGQAKPFAIEPSFFSRIDEVARWAIERGLAVILNIHHYEEMAADPRGQELRLQALWRQIASHYAAAPASLFFELLNEPNGACDTNLWGQLATRLIPIIRQSNPTRPLILGGGDWNSLDQLPLLTLPNDPGLIATFHYYQPFKFTHQGAEWMAGSDAWLGTTWTANEAECAQVVADFDGVAQWSRQTQVPILLGEFGAYSKAPQPSRLAWTRFIRQQAEARGFGWAYWEFGAGFGLYDRDAGCWREDLLGALLVD